MTTDPIDPARVREAVARVRHQDVQSGYGVADPEDVELLATAALDALTQRDTVRELSEAMAGLESEVRRRKAMQPVDSDGSPITQAAANRLLGAYDELPKLRADLDELVTEQGALFRERDQLRSKLEAARAERDALETRRASGAEDLRLAKLDLTARLHTICSELGGLVEGFPTASHNYLQRIRELRQIEAERDAAVAKLLDADREINARTELCSEVNEENAQLRTQRNAAVSRSHGAEVRAGQWAARCDQLEAVLRPFADRMESFARRPNSFDYSDAFMVCVSLGDLRAARAALVSADDAAAARAEAAEARLDDMSKAYVATGSQLSRVREEVWELFELVRSRFPDAYNAVPAQLIWDWMERGAPWEERAAVREALNAARAALVKP